MAHNDQSRGEYCASDNSAFRRVTFIILRRIKVQDFPVRGLAMSPISTGETKFTFKETLQSPRSTAMVVQPCGTRQTKKNEKQNKLEIQTLAALRTGNIAV